MEFMTDWETFMLDFADEKIFRVSQVKKVFTPYEQEQKFTDEQHTETLGDYRIASSIELPNKELLVGLRPVYVNEEIIDKEFVETLELGENIEYYALKDILLVDITNSDEYSFLHRKDNDEEADDEI